MRDIDTAGRRIAEAVREGQRILFVGDFDADGATSVALGVSVLRAFGAERGRLRGSEPVRVRLRPVPGNRSRGAGQAAGPADHGGQRRLQHRGSRTRQCRGCRCHHHRSSPARSGTSAGLCRRPIRTCRAAAFRARPLPASESSISFSPGCAAFSGKRAGLQTTARRNRISLNGSTWLPWGRSRTWCPWTATTAPWFTRGSCVCAKAVAGMEFRLWRKCQEGPCPDCGPLIWGSRSAPG